MANVMDWGIEMGIFPGLINYYLYVYTRVHFHVCWDNIIMIQNMYSVVGYSIHCDSFSIIHQTDDAGSESFS